MLPVISTDYYKVKDVKDVIRLANNNMYNGEKTNITVVCEDYYLLNSLTVYLFTIMLRNYHTLQIFLW